MSEFNEIPDFLQDLIEDTSKKPRGEKPEVQVLNMKSKKNWGRLFIVPINGANPGEGAIKQLNRVAHVEKWVEGKKQDGTDYGFVRRIFFFLDPKYYGELTDDQLKQLDRIKSKFNEVYNRKTPGVQIHQVTLIQGYILSHTEYKTQKLLHDHIPAICIFESKNFEKAFTKTLTDQATLLKSYKWLNDMCNREAKRKRYLDIDFFLDPEVGAGFQATTKLGKFDEDAVALTNGNPECLDLSDKGEEFFGKFMDPIKTFISVNQEGPRFDQDQINEIEVILNNLIKGETFTETRTAPVQGDPTKPNSNSNFVEQSETEPIPTSVEAEDKAAEQAASAVEKAENEDTPF